MSREPALVSHAVGADGEPTRSVAVGNAIGGALPKQDPSAPAVKRAATIEWLGHPPGGEPRLTIGSHSLTSLPPLNVDLNVTYPLATSPFELLAGAIGAVFARFVAEQLVKEGTPARELHARVTLTFSGRTDAGTQPVLTGVACQVSGRGAGIGQVQLGGVAQGAMTRCMETLAMRPEGIAVTVDDSLARFDPSGSSSHGPTVRVRSPRRSETR
jgi:hypothetical protein